MMWIGTEAALERLGVRVQTLYAYVSRGRVEARPDPDDPRRSLYSSADIDGLVRRRVRGRRAVAVAQEAIAWGEPVLDSAVSTVLAGRLVYRGADAVVLAETASLETVAALLWQAPETAFPTTRQAPGPPATPTRGALFERLAERAGGAPDALGRPAPALRSDAAEIVGEMAAAVAGVAAEPGERVHDQVVRGWSPDQDPDPVAAGVVRRALVLLADHELNASTFAARVAASTGASLAASALCGFSALSGPLHGAAGQAVATLAREAGREGRGPGAAGAGEAGRGGPGVRPSEAVPARRCARGGAASPVRTAADLSYAQPQRAGAFRAGAERRFRPGRRRRPLRFPGRRAVPAVRARPLRRLAGARHRAGWGGPPDPAAGALYGARAASDLMRPDATGRGQATSRELIR